MADPRELAPTNRRDTRSELLKAQAASTTGEKVNFCPFQCQDVNLDEHGYCKHLIGFTNDGKSFEPMVKVKGGRRLVRVPKEETGEFILDETVDDEGEVTPTKVPVFKPVLQPILPGDKLVRISISSRVYRDVAKQAVPA